MRTDPRSTNRLVYAHLEMTEEALSRKYVEQMLDESDWYFERQQDRSYIVAIPLYCARIVALQEARDLIQDFSQRRVPMRIRELRLTKRVADKTKLVSVTRTSGNWVNLFCRKLRESPELILSPLHWQITIPRSKQGDLNTRNSQEISRTYKALRSSKLPGEIYNSKTMQIVTATEPKNVVTDPWEKPWRSILTMVLAVLLMAVILTGATIVWLDVKFLWKFVSFVVTTRILISSVLWVTGNRTNQWLRLGSILVVCVVVFFLGLVLSLTIQDLPSFSISYLFQAVGNAALIIFTFFGWVHLTNIYPKVRAVWAISVISLLVAGAYAGAKMLINNGESLVKIPPETAAIPSWIELVATLYIIAWVGGALLVLGSVFGWASYFGFASASLVLRTFGYLLALLLTAYFFLLASAIVLSKPENLLQEWTSSIEEGTTPNFSSEFFYRACLSTPLKSEEAEAMPSGPLAVLESNDGGFWYWEITEETTFKDSPTFIEYNQFSVSRLPNGSDDCS